MSNQPDLLTPMSAPDQDPDLVDRIFDYILTQMPEVATQVKDIDALKSDVRAEFAGSKCYVALTPRTERGRRVEEFMRLFNGRNAKEVARHLNIGKTTVYRLIKQAGKPPDGS